MPRIGRERADPDGPRVWAMPEIPGDVKTLRDVDGGEWRRSDVGLWECYDGDGRLLAAGVPDDVLLSSYAPLTEVIPR